MLIPLLLSSTTAIIAVEASVYRYNSGRRYRVLLLLPLAHTVTNTSFIGLFSFLMIIVQEGFSSTCHILLQVLY